MNCFKPARTIAWSSAMRIRIIGKGIRAMSGPSILSRQTCGLQCRDPRFARLIRGEAVVQRLQTDAQYLGGPTLVAAAMVERRKDRLALHLGQRRADWNAEAFPLDRRTGQSAQIELHLVVRHDE